ncbi:hypothetical protein BDV95DRAFT_98879 [Massariosphaeria phaeospora]|uniref:Mucin n=1 Tax=Massariosphaeria phaeospora TaxID=100035 RepID=A0A7C8I2W1_9PLEO|nr:hypothetical protein BDV95DRAFT_98879 [Massariosphaeria phaeospora]
MRSQSRSSRAKESTATPYAQYEALPLALKRKQFSSLERLRIAEHQHQLLLLQQQASQPVSVRRRSSRTPKAALHRQLTPGSTRCRSRKDRSRQERDFSQAEADFFLSLPHKLRKQHFSREEQVLLAGRCDQNAASERAQQRFEDFHFGLPNDSVTSFRRGRSRRRSCSVHSVSPNRPSQSRPTQEDWSTEANHPHLPTMSPPVSYPVRPRSGFKRTLSLSNIPLRTSTASAPTMIDPPPFSAGTQPAWHQRAHSQSVSGRRSSHAPTTPLFDPEATHYRDPEARKTLRMFLASPQKFDEAVEFGFPSAAGSEEVKHRYQLPPIATDARNFSRDMQTFLRDDRISFLEDDDEDQGLESDGDSTVDLESPVTPSSIGMSFRGHARHLSPSTYSSLDSTGLPLNPLNPMSGRLNREMTLRMTLTRPDLRADDDQLYGWQGAKGGKDDPFALEELPVSDDMTGSKGAFAVKPKPQGNLVTRLFKRASKRGQR